jgi:LacI family transcriptional regulator
VTSGKGRVTIKAIAEEAGCSFSAVSKVLNQGRGNIRVGAELSERIRAVAEELGYVPSYGAQVLRRGCSDTVGVLAGRIQSAFSGQMLEGIYDGLRESGYHVLVLRLEDDASPLPQLERILNEGRVDSVITLNDFSQAEIEAIKKSPASSRLVVAWSAGGTGLVEVVADPAPGLCESVAHLAGLGHRAIIFAGGRGGKDADWVEPRWRILCQAAAERGVACRRVGIDELAATVGDATAVVAANDVVAFKAMASLRESGRTIPGDMSIIGYDDVHAHLAAPGLTTVHYGLDGIGAAAAGLARRIAAQRPVEKTTTVASHLVVRGSTASAAPRR